MAWHSQRNCIFRPSTARRSPPMKLTDDIRSERLLYAKAGLFAIAGLMACVTLVLDHPTLRTAVLLAVAVFCCCRAYYFAFYVIEKYIDPSYRFAGLLSLVTYWRECRTKSKSEWR